MQRRMLMLPALTLIDDAVPSRHAAAAPCAMCRYAATFADAAMPAADAPTL